MSRQNSSFQVWYSQPGLDYSQEIKVQAEWVRVDPENERQVTLELNSEFNDVTAAIELPGRVVSITLVNQEDESKNKVLMDRRFPGCQDWRVIAMEAMDQGKKVQFTRGECFYTAWVDNGWHLETNLGRVKFHGVYVKPELITDDMRKIAPLDQWKVVEA